MLQSKELYFPDKNVQYFFLDDQRTWAAQCHQPHQINVIHPITVGLQYVFIKCL